MKLNKKIIPLGAVCATIAGLAPVISSCGIQTGWIDGTKQVDTSKFDLCQEQIIVKDNDIEPWWQKCALEATRRYVQLIEEKHGTIKNDLWYSLNQMNSILPILKDASQKDWPTTLDQILLDLEIPESLWEIIHEYLPLTPVRTLEAKKLRGKVSNFEIISKEPEYLASYNQQIDLDIVSKIGFDYLPKEIKDLIESLGFDIAINIEIKASVDCKFHKIPFIVWADPLQIYKQTLLDYINDKPDSEESTNHGLCFLPDIQNYEYLGDNKEWYGLASGDLSVSIFNENIKISLVGTTVDKFRLDYYLYHYLFDEQQNRIEIPEWLVLVLVMMGGWSSYYYSTQEYPSPFKF